MLSFLFLLLNVFGYGEKYHEYVCFMPTKFNWQHTHRERERVNQYIIYCENALQVYVSSIAYDYITVIIWWQTCRPPTCNHSFIRDQRLEPLCNWSLSFAFKKVNFFFLFNFLTYIHMRIVIKLIQHSLSSEYKMPLIEGFITSTKKNIKNFCRKWKKLSKSAIFQLFFSPPNSFFV